MIIKRAVSLILIIIVSIVAGSCSNVVKTDNTAPGIKSTISGKETATIYDGKKSIDENITKFLQEMTLEEKVGQMLQVEQREISVKDTKKYFIGSIFAAGGSAPEENTMEKWAEMTQQFKAAALETRLGIPLLFAVDAVHGNNNMKDTIIFPHNIGLGASGDSELIMDIAGMVATELNAAGVDWNFSPCIAVSNDIRWGRTYECFSENPDLVSIMSIPYITTLQTNGIIACAKHYVADGAVKFGTGDSGYLMDQGNVEINQRDLNDYYLSVYKEAVAAGVKSIMVSYSSINSEKNHSNKFLINDQLKEDMGFNGIVISDFQGIHQLRGDSLYDQVVLAVNTGIDILMEASQWKECYDAIIEAAGNSDIRMERIDDAVSRILRVKMEMGKFDSVQMFTGDYKLRNFFHQQIAEEAVAKSLVLLKNKNNVLPITNQKNIAVIGPAADNIGIQCGGWTKTWQGGQDDKNGRWMNGTTILDGFKEIAAKNGSNIITDLSKLSKADVIVAVLGEYPYAEGKGDDDSLDLYGGTALAADNESTLKAAYAAKKPIVVVLISGRPRIVTKELDKWDGFIQAWLPGTEGGVIAKSLYGEYEFNARLPVTWPRGLEQLPITINNQSDGYNALFPYGYGLNIKN